MIKKKLRTIIDGIADEYLIVRKVTIESEPQRRMVVEGYVIVEAVDGSYTDFAGVGKVFIQVARDKDGISANFQPAVDYYNDPTISNNEAAWQILARTIEYNRGLEKGTYSDIPDGVHPVDVTPVERVSMSKRSSLNLEKEE